MDRGAGGRANFDRSIGDDGTEAIRSRTRWPSPIEVLEHLRRNVVRIFLFHWVFRGQFLVFTLLYVLSVDVAPLLS